MRCCHADPETHEPTSENTSEKTSENKSGTGAPRHSLDEITGAQAGNEIGCGSLLGRQNLWATVI